MLVYSSSGMREIPSWAIQKYSIILQNMMCVVRGYILSFQNPFFGNSGIKQFMFLWISENNIDTSTLSVYVTSLS